MPSSIDVLNLADEETTVPRPRLRHRPGDPATRAALAVAVLLFVTVAPFVQSLTAQPAVRYAATAALAEERTVVLDEYEHAIGVDFVTRDGHLYSDKAPAQQVLAVPFYAAYRLVGGESARDLRVEENLGLWWLALWTSVIPLAALGFLLVRDTYETAGRSIGPAVTVLFGTLLLPFGSQLYAHVLAALALYVMWHLASGAAPTPRRLAAAGFAAGAAVGIEFTAGLVVAGVGVWLAWQHRRRLPAILPFVAGGVPWALLVGALNHAVTGDPLRAPHRLKHDDTLSGVGLPKLSNVSDLLFDERGFLFSTPIVLVAVYAAVRLLADHRTGGRARTVGLAAAGCVGLLFLVPAGWGNPWGGEIPGPRYLIPALPLLAITLAAQWPRARRLAWASLAVGLPMMTLPLIADHLIPEGAAPLDWYRHELTDQGAVATVWTMAAGGAGWLLHLATVAGALGWLVRVQRRSSGGVAPAAAQDAVTV